MARIKVIRFHWLVALISAGHLILSCMQIEAKKQTKEVESRKCPEGVKCELIKYFKDKLRISVEDQNTVSSVLDNLKSQRQSWHGAPLSASTESNRTNRKVWGRAQCTGNAYEDDQCTDCINYAVEELRDALPHGGAFFEIEGCKARYGFFNFMRLESIKKKDHEPNMTLVKFNWNIDQMDADETAAVKKGFDIILANIPDANAKFSIQAEHKRSRVYMMSKCSKINKNPRVNRIACDECIRAIIESVLSMVNYRKGMNYVTNSCSLRYEFNDFETIEALDAESTTTTTESINTSETPTEEATENPETATSPYVLVPSD